MMLELGDLLQTRHKAGIVIEKRPYSFGIVSVVLWRKADNAPEDACGNYSVEAIWDDEPDYWYRKVGNDEKAARAICNVLEEANGK